MSILFKEHFGETESDTEYVRLGVERFYKQYGNMTIYFVHILFLRTFREFSFFERGMSGMLLLFAAVFVCSLFAAILLDHTVLKLEKRIRTIIARNQRAL